MANLSVHLAAVLGAAGAVLVLVGERRAALIAGFAALAAAEVCFAIAISDDAVGSVIGPTAAAMGLAGLLVVGGLGALFIRYPALVMPFALAAAPFRLPLDFDPTHRFFVAVAGDAPPGTVVHVTDVNGARRRSWPSTAHRMPCSPWSWAPSGWRRSA